MPDTIPIARPVLGEDEARQAARVIASGWVMQGPEVAAFEAEFAAYVGAAQAVAVSSGTAALHLALLCANLDPGAEVITVSHSFIATANCVRMAGAIPVFVDIEPGSFNIDVEQVSRALNPRTRAVLCVHQMGLPCDLRALSEITGKAGVPLIEDAACAVGSEIRWGNDWQRIGRPHGAIACFSFHPRKLLTTGEGGMLTTSDAAIASRARALRQHGAAASEAPFVETGFNYRMTDIQAAVGRVQLGRLPEVLARNRERARRYAEALASVPGLVLPSEPAWSRSNFQSYCIRLPDRIDVTAVREQLARQGISTRAGIANAHQEPAYAAQPRLHPLTASEAARQRCLMLPLFPELTPSDQQRVVEALRHALG